MLKKLKSSKSALRYKLSAQSGRTCFIITHRRSMLEYCDVIFEISDSGEGVAEENLEVIFEPLYTSDQGRKVAGLGLAICREIIDGHGGKIYAGKSESGGLTICIELDRKANYD